MTTFAARLQKLRIDARLTQTELAIKAGVSQKAVSHWETGDREPTLANAQALAKALGVDCRAFDETPPAATAAAGAKGKAKVDSKSKVGKASKKNDNP